ncbi:MAG TPA: ATP-dependent DNA helicase RecQ [Edaphocola sp.]|nr:ATP-dependent DNA helicase RecQ [Edaphocola sp.]
MSDIALKILKQYWGYEGFRQFQSEIIQSVLQRKDVLAVLPTGAGKSICFQIPALAFDGLTIVVSPLIALMEDQVIQLKQRNVPACFLHSGMDQLQYEENLYLIREKEIKLLYISPERLQNDHFLETIQPLKLSLIAVDEAHCISEWGHDFRPSYRKILEFKQRFTKVPVIALTASATTLVRKDIIEQLDLKDAKIFEQSIIRDNLSYHVIYAENKIPLLIKYLSKITHGSTIIYCGSRRRTIELANELNQRLNKPAYSYHAGMHRQEKKFAYQQWSQQEGSIICATSAFGMGIDKADVRLVVHFDLPVNIEQYYQEVGRAGRDGLEAKGVLFYNHKDLHRLSQLSEIQNPPISFIKSIYPLLMDHLNIGFEEGREWTKAFNIIDFCKIFKLDLLPTISAIKILEQESYWVWNEDARTKYTIVFNTNRTQIEFIEQNYPTLYEVIEVLLRHYGSIYHFETPIQIFEMSKLLKIDKTIFEERLFQLESMGILHYHPAIIGSHIYFLENRVKLDFFRLDEIGILKRKEIFSNKIQSFLNYIEEKGRCRNALLATYFDDKIPKEHCGACDFCIDKNLNQEANTIEQNIIFIIKEKKNISLDALLSHFPNLAPKYVITQLQKLIDEQKLFITGNILHL